MKKTLLVILVMIIAGGGTFLALRFADNFSNSDNSDTVDDNTTAQEILDSIGSEENLVETGNIEPEIQTGDIEEENQGLSVILSVETSSEITSIKGDLSAVPEGLVQKVAVIACDGNLATTYDDPYTLQKYEYPNFQYNLRGDRNNVCAIPYQIVFYGSGDEEIDMQEYQLDPSIIKSISLGTKTFVGKADLKIQFDYPNIGNPDMAGNRIQNFGNSNSFTNETGGYTVEISAYADGQCDSQNYSDKTEVGTSIIYKSKSEIEDLTEQTVTNICIQNESKKLNIEIIENDEYSQALTTIRKTLQIIPEPSLETLKNLEISSISINSDNKVSLSSNEITWKVIFKNTGNDPLLISDSFPISVECIIPDYLTNGSHYLNRDYKGKVLQANETVSLSFKSTVNDKVDNFPGSKKGICSVARNSNTQIQKTVEVEVTE